MMPDWLAQLGVLDPGSVSQRLARAILLASVFAGEWIMPADARQRPWSPALVHDVVWYGGLRTFRVLIVLEYLQLLFALYHGALALPAFDWEGTPEIFRGIAALMLRDSFSWGSHWLRHRVKLFWPLHAMHHAQRQMNPYLSHRNHPLDDLIDASLTCIPVFAFGLHITAATVLAVFAIWYPMICHANLRSDFGLLRFVLVTPQSHRMHHSTTQEGMASNFGTIFSIWDRLFGTHVEAAPGVYPAVGLDGADEWRQQRWRDIPVQLWRNLVEPPRLVAAAWRDRG